MSTGRTAAFLIHGLGGTQFDLGSMHKTLRRAGIDTHSLTLPGHGTTPEDLAGVRAEAWLAAVTAKYREVVMQYDTVHVIGMCMGSLLALALCAQEGHARGRLVTLAPPIYIDGWATPWYRAFRHLMYWLPFVPNRMRVDEDEPFGIKNALVRSIVKAKFERGDNFHYRWVPLACIREVDRLRRIAKRGARALRCDTLVMHAREDELTSLKSAYFLRDHVERAEIVVLENSYHLICVDNDRQLVATSILRFLGLDPAAADKPAAEAEPDVPMAAEEVRALAARYMSAMSARQFEAALPLFASEVVWEQRGVGPLARDYAGRTALIDLFSSLLDRSDGSFAVQSFGEPRFEGQTVTADVAFTATRAGRTFHGAAKQTFVLRNGRISHVVYEPDDAAAEAAFWGSGSEAAPVCDTPSTELAALGGDALRQRFERAQSSVKALARRPSNDMLLRLYACYKQATDGDASGAQPSALDPKARAKHTAWARLAGVDANDAMRRYVALAEQLDRETVETA
ncbi:alpha/beta hydrolase family protein [Caballeronia choica]|uniref:Alpha/beta hydrolase family protein n=1 Tax=Caballeronia choica TaxID=326476 RepID=A0A158HKB6_9BURK|nr:acyl-CoA-binding protein [Caballeronia choica]SAL44838.1 alpha/beta hydrolase family protein [Caballeronia choica]